jgi:hypothetical protein
MSDLKNQKEQATTSRDILPQRDESPVPLVSFTPKLIASIPKRRLNCSEPSSSISLSGTLPKFALKRPSFIKLTLKQGGPQDQTDETSEYNLSQESRRIPFLTKSEVSTKQLTSSICSDTKLESTGESLQKRKEDCSLTTVGHELGQAGSPVFQPKPYYLNPNSLGEQQLREAHFREDKLKNLKKLLNSTTLFGGGPTAVPRGPNESPKPSLKKQLRHLNNTTQTQETARPGAGSPEQTDKKVTFAKQRLVLVFRKSEMEFSDDDGSSDGPLNRKKKKTLYLRKPSSTSKSLNKC